MKRTIIMATLFIAGGLALTAANTACRRDERINRNTEIRTDNRVERRENAAEAIGAPGLDEGIERRNERRKDRRIELRTGQPPTDQSPPQQ
jgi:hypothetical protein